MNNETRQRQTVAQAHWVAQRNGQHVERITLEGRTAIDESSTHPLDVRALHMPEHCSYDAWFDASGTYRTRNVFCRG